ncbi:MAG: DNA repair protein RecO [Actinomycetaceae bacterium]|nr:DNA repair protein RecO [Actinomycetaceae bacterium]
MRTYRDEAIVLRTHPLGEADRIITILTRHHGMVRCVAKGVRRTKSRFGARLEPFSVVQAMLYRGRNLDVLTQVETIRPYGLDVAGDYDLYTRANVMAEVTEQVCAQETEEASFLLLLGAIHALAKRRHDADLVMNSYLLRLMALNGWAPSLHGCAVCGRADEWNRFNPGGGGLVCEECDPSPAPVPAPQSVQLLIDLLSGDWPRAKTAPLLARREASSLVAAWVQWHLTRRISSYHLVPPLEVAQ